MGFVLVMGWLGRRDYPVVFAGWSAIVFFGACAMIAAWRLGDSRPRIIIDDEGVFDRRWGCAIPWSDIVGVQGRELGTTQLVCLELRDPGKQLRRSSLFYRVVSATNGLIGYSPFTMNLAGTDATADEVLEAIIRGVQRNARPRVRHSLPARMAAYLLRKLSLRLLYLSYFDFRR